MLTASLGLAPAVIGAASNPSGGEAALVGALIAALGGAASLLLRDGSRTVVTGLTIDRLERGPAQGETSRTMLTVDYTVELSVNVGGPSFPLRVSDPRRQAYEAALPRRRGRGRHRRGRLVERHRARHHT